MSYSTNEIKNKLRIAVSDVTPDVLEGILSNCEDRKGTVTTMKITTNTKKWIPRVIAAAAAFVLMAGGTFGYIAHQKNTGVDSVIALDVNPSIEMKVNINEKVIEINPLNDDAVKIIGGMDFKGVSMEVAVNALIGSMLEHGYISELQNSILLTVKNNNAEKGALLEKKLSAEIANLLKEKSIDGAILAQAAPEDEELEKLAKSHNISTGKAKLINEIIAQDSTQNFEKLSKLSINQLNLFAESKNMTLENTESTGSASDKAYIGKEKAKEIAFSHAKTSNHANVIVEFDFDDGKMIYEVEFNDGTLKYDYDIDAVTGNIILNEKEKFDPTEKEDNPSDKDDDKDDDKDQPSDKDDDKDDDKDQPSDKDDDKDDDNNDDSDKNPENPSVPKPDPSNDIGKAQATELAFKHAGVQAEKVSNLFVIMDNDNGKTFYEVDFNIGNNEYDYKVDSSNGTLLESDKKTTDGNDSDDETDEETDDANNADDED